MILLLKHFTKKKKLHVSSLFIISIIALIMTYINQKIFYFMVIIDVYFYLLLTQFKIVNISYGKKSESDINMEIIAEGTRKAETNNLADTIIEYTEKFNT